MDARRWLTLGSVFCMLVLLSNCNQDTTVFGPQDTKAFASGFAGQVVDRKGQGVSGALVTALPGGATTVSGDGGRFELGNLASGTYRLSLSKVDYRDTSVGDSVALGLRETKTVLPQALQYRYGSIRGKVLDSSGVPQYSAGVVVQEQDASTIALVDGSFQLKRVEPGKIKLFSAVSGYGYGTREVELRADSQVEVEVRIDHKGGTVTGKVTKDDGLTPLAGATVSAVGGALHTVTKDDGSYSLGQVPQTASITIVSGDQKAQVNGVQVAEGGRASVPDLRLSQVPTGTMPALLNGMSLGVTTDSVVTLVAADAKGSDTSWHVRRYLWSLDAGRTWDSTSTGVLRLHPAQLGWAEGLHRVKVRMRLYRILGENVLDSTSAVATIDVRLLPPPDITPPHLLRVSPLKDTTVLAWQDSIFVVEWKVTDNRRLDTAILDDLPGSQQGSRLSRNDTLPVGTTTVRAWARDSAGNVARDSVVFVRSHKPARDSSLSLLVVGQDTIHSTLVPAFASGRLDYVDTVSATDSVVWVRAVAKDTAAGVTIAGVTLKTKSVKLNDVGSSTPIRVVVRAGDGDTLAYVVDVFRRAATTSDSSIPWNNAIAYGTLLDSRDGKSYRTVKIGTQTWMAENLNYRNTTGSADTVGVCYNNNADSCAKYGRLYTWPETMKGAASSAAIPSGVQGVCPAGWHVPSDGEWNILIDSVERTSGVGSGNSGIDLKATFSWISGTGSDAHGFRILPGGRILSQASQVVGMVADFWSSKGIDAGTSWGLDYRYNLTGASRGPASIAYAFSLRCLQNSVDTFTTLHALTLDSGTVTSTFDSTILSYTDSVASTVTSLHVTATASSASDTVKINGVVVTSGVATLVNVPTDTTITIVVSNPNTTTKRTYTVRVAHKAAAVVTMIPWNTSITYGTLLDSRDGKSYRTVKIGTQTWMAENLNYRNTTGSADTVGVCYNNNADSCAKYGRLYTWPETMKGAASSAAIPSGVQGVCPAGWHVPSDGEWRRLQNKVGKDSGWSDSLVGDILKAGSVWSPGGNDGFGFRALPAGRWHENHISFDNIGSYALYWTSTDANSALATRIGLSNGEQSVYAVSDSKERGFSIRCIQSSSDTLITLHALALDSGVLNRSFDSTILSYTDSVASTVTSLHVTATASSSSDTVKINGIVVNSGMATLVNVSTDTTITIVVSNPNTTTKRTYTVRVAHKAAAVVTMIPWNTSITYGTLLDSRDGKSYRTVKIGTQTWMAENLNYRNTTGSADTVGFSFAYWTGADSSSKYGRLYTWTEAMAGSVSSESVPSSVKGVCPSGWHIPSNMEWKQLISVHGDSTTAGTAMKSISGWEISTDVVNSNGNDKYGMRILPAGYPSYVMSQGGSGSDAFYLSSTESSAAAGISWCFANRSNGIYRFNWDKIRGLSLRCVQDIPDTLTTLHRIVFDSGSLSPVFDSNVTTYTDTVSATVSSFNVSASPSSSNATLTINGSQVASGAAVTVLVPKDTTITFVVANGPRARTYTVRVVHRIATRAGNNLTAAALGLDASWNQTISTYDTFTDTRDGHLYRSVKIGNQVWMAENLNYRKATSGTDTLGKCYSNSVDSCAKYGRLYTWAEVMAGVASSAAIPSGVNGICPTGWHVPSDAEWTTMQTFVDASNTTDGTKLKSTSGWPTNTGTDVYGFRALPGGYFNGTSVNYVGRDGGWWSATESGASLAWNRNIKFLSSVAVGRMSADATYGFSLRCSQD